MYSLSRPTSSSSAPPSRLPSPPSSSSSSSSTSSDSSTTEVLSVREIQSLPSVETMVRGNNSTDASDRSGSPEHSFPQGLHWVDPKVTRITSAFVKRAPVADFLDRVGVLKPDVSVDVIGIKPCEVPDTVCSTRSLTERPFFTCTLVCFLTFTSLSLLITSRWCPSGAQHGSYSTASKYLGVYLGLPHHLRCFSPVSYPFNLS